MRRSRTNAVVISKEARVLREMRLARGLSMKQVGLLVDRSDSYISQIENGRTDPPKGIQLERLLVAYGGSKLKSFHERVRLFRYQVCPKDELHDLIERMKPNQVQMAVAVVRGLLAGQE